MLAGTVPADQEDQAGPKEIQVCTALNLVGRCEAPRDEVELRRAEPIGLGTWPRRLIVLQKVSEEADPLFVHVGTGDADRKAIDMDDDHVRVGRADIILDY